MLVGRRRFVVGLSAAMVVGLLSVVAAPVALAETIYVADMTGDQEVPGPGDPDGTGYAELRIDPGSGQVCAFISVADVSEPTAAHIHAGDAGVAGGIVVTLPTPTGGEVDDCVSGLDAGVLQAIVDDPASYYVNVHTADFPAGALRGQLAALDITWVNVYKAVCPPEIQTPADLDQGGAETCVPAWRTGDLDLPAGYTWEIEPVEFDMDIEVVDDSGTLTIADAELEGGASCSSITMTCTGRRGYGFYPIVQGPVSVTQLSTPAGYRFGWAIASSAVEGEAAPPFDVDVDGASITLDSTGFDQAVSVTIYDFAGAQTPSPSVLITPPPAPTLLITPPPTSTAGVPRSTPSFLPLTLVAGLLTMVGFVAFGARRARARRH